MSAVSDMPQRLGKYEVRREVGRGGMGVVYEGFDPNIDRRVALKTFIDEFFDGTKADNLLTRLRREAQAAGRLSHPNIIAVYDYGEESARDATGAALATAFIAMEFVEGRSLESYFNAHERFPLPEVVRIMSELLGALEYSHEAGVVHRDIKPANIILLKDGTVKVADFGVARIESSTLTQLGTVLGSPSYMSPEQFMGQTVDGRSDVYSAGVVLYELLTGEVAFTGAFTTIMHRVLNDKAPPPSALNVQVPPAYDAVIQRAMAKRPDERYQSAAEFKQAIVAAQAARSAGGTALGQTGTAVRLPGNGSIAGGSGAPHSGPASGTAVWLTPGKLFVLLGVIVAMLAGGGYWWYSHGNSTVASNAGAANAVAAPGGPQAGRPVGSFPSAAIVTAVGVANPSDPALANVPGGATRVVNDDAREQIVAKAAALYVEPESLNSNYPLLRAKLLSRNGDFLTDVVQQTAPQVGGDGLLTGIVSAKVNLREVQQALNAISRDDRVNFIRNNGNPRISVAISAAEPNDPDDAPPAPSAVAENILKERIRSFGFTVVDADANPPADFRVSGEVRFKRLSARLPASGLVIEKFALTSWTVNAADAKSGEEIYHNTAIPEKQSWATQELALQEVGRLIGAEFNKNFFLQYFDFKPTKVRLRVSGLPAAKAPALLAAVNSSLVVMNAVAVPSTGSDLLVDADLSGGTASPATTIEGGVLAPLNRKMGSSCFTTIEATAAELHIALAPSCLPAATLDRLDNANIRSTGTAAPMPQNAVQDPGTPQRLKT